MRFRKTSSPPSWFSSRDQRRVTSFLCLLVMVIFAIDVTRKPENWNWFFALSEQSTDGQADPLKEIDFRVKLDPAPLPLDSFVALPDTSTVAATEEPQEIDIQQVPRQFLEGVEDQRLGHLRSDDGPIQKMVEQLAHFSQKELLEAGRADVGYRIVNVDPDIYRGELLYLNGKLWRLAPYRGGKPLDQDPDLKLWEAWMFTEDSGNNPWVILLTEKPEGIEPGNEIDRHVKVAGYFLKRYGYPTKDGMHVAPMLVGKTLTPLLNVTEGKREDMEITYYVVGILSGVAVLFGLMIAWFALSDRKYRHSRAAQIAEQRLEATTEEVAEMNQLPAEDPEETFRKLQEGDSRENEA